MPCHMRGVTFHFLIWIRSLTWNMLSHIMPQFEFWIQVFVTFKVSDSSGIFSSSFSVSNEWEVEWIQNWMNSASDYFKLEWRQLGDTWLYAYLKPVQWPKMLDYVCLTHLSLCQRPKNWQFALNRFFSSSTAN